MPRFATSNPTFGEERSSKEIPLRMGRSASLLSKGNTLSELSTQRALIHELKLLKRILKLQKVRQALQNIGTDPATLFPAKQLRSCGLATVESFATSALKAAP